MHDALGIARALKRIAPVKYPERNLFRCVEMSALVGGANRRIQPLFDLGPGRSGQRFTPVGGPRALYVAEDPYTSYLESTGMFDSVADLAEKLADTQSTLQFRVQLEEVLDLTVADTMLELGTNQEELLASWEWQMATGARVPTQDLGAAAFASKRFQAIRFTSAKRADHANLVIFTDRVVAPAFVECTDSNFPDRLP
ncbi:MAG TPA: RES family NAD+ phosphorylase [Candidatus Obscuribacter sp.]|nr:RES family NAD+ phosphorylase [Candidatus Obscuribacter sp.]HMY01723.1 RES family NAD+ phosphorylase [Candidatus Obscuribacter sp.]HNG74133.1 RES family NAD+ phosphorylase [Candidatus Obscuribacter sp.]HNH75507.1 RES family NAD+ phosphorylase [Candidatus Obscuribacter sp.]